MNCYANYPRFFVSLFPLHFIFTITLQFNSICLVSFSVNTLFVLFPMELSAFLELFLRSFRVFLSGYYIWPKLLDIPFATLQSLSLNSKIKSLAYF